MSTPPKSDNPSINTNGNTPNTTDKPIRVQLLTQPERQKYILNSINPNITLTQFQLLIQDSTSIKPNKQLLFSGFPPKEIETSIVNNNNSITIKELGIRNGDTVEVRTRDSDIKHELQQGRKWSWPATINSQAGSFKRVEMPRDNSCLFHTIGYVCENKLTPNQANSHKIRELAANLVASDPQKYNTVFLGSPNKLYQDHILNPNTWGGAIELLLLSNHYQTEIYAFDYLNLREDIFGGGNEYKRRVFILYTGDHYDAMAYSNNNSALNEQVLFSTKDDQAWIRARDFIHSLHTDSARQGQCELQPNWRHNTNLQRNSASVVEKKRLEAVKIDEQKKQQNMKELKENDLAMQQAIAASISVDTSDNNNMKTNSPMSPESKNDYFNCTTCTLKNPLTSTQCSACGTKSPFADSIPNNLVNNNHNITNIPSPSSGETWSCPACTAFNPISKVRCTVCSERNPSAPSTAVDDFGTGTSTHDSDGVRSPIPQHTDTLINPEPVFNFTPLPVSNSGGIMGSLGLGSGIPPRVVNLPPEAKQAAEMRRRAIEEACKEPFNCTKCTLYNEANSLACSACQEPNPNIAKLKNSTNNNNDSNKKKSLLSGLFKPSGPRWTCEMCATEQSANLIRCKSCKNPNVNLIAQQQQDPGCNIM